MGLVQNLKILVRIVQSPTLKVGSSFVNRFRALLKFAVESRDLGMIARDITGSGTVIGNMEYLHHVLSIPLGPGPILWGPLTYTRMHVF